MDSAGAEPGPSTIKSTDDEEDEFWKILASCIKKIEVKSKEIDRLSLLDISYDELGNASVNEKTKDILSKTLAKETKHLEDILQKFLQLKNKKGRFEYVQVANKPPEQQFLAKKINKFLNYQHQKGPQAPETMYLMKLTQMCLKNAGMAEVEGLVEGLAEEAVGSVQNARKRKARDEMLSLISQEPDPAELDKELEKKLEQNRLNQETATDDLVSAFRKDSKIYKIESSTDPGEDENSTDTDEDEGSTDSVEDDEAIGPLDPCIQELSAQVDSMKKNVITISTDSENDVEDDDDVQIISDPSPNKKSRLE